MNTSFQILSDLHLEFHDFLPTIKKVADNLILAGDIGNLKSKIFIQFLDFVNKTWTHTFYILGNHEFYLKRYSKEELEYEYEKLIKEYPNIHFLNRSSYLLENIEILGCTLWSQPKIEFYGSDFSAIHKLNTDKISKKKYINITSKDIYDFHKKDIEWLETALLVSSAQTKIVITHFMPLMNTEIPSSPYETNEIINSYYGNNLQHLLFRSNIWISGHTHHSFNLKKQDTQWICNAHGYPGEFSNYDENLVI